VKIFHIRYAGHVKRKMERGEIGQTVLFGLNGVKTVKMDKMEIKEIRVIRETQEHLVLMLLLI